MGAFAYRDHGFDFALPPRMGKLWFVPSPIGQVVSHCYGCVISWATYPSPHTIFICKCAVKKGYALNCVVADLKLG